MTLRRADTGTVLQLGARIAAGGEGVIHALPGDDARCVKLYHAALRTADRRAKIEAMLSRPPADPAEAQRHRSIAWPEACVLEDGAFAGFLMPRAPAGAATALTYMQPDGRQIHSPGFHFGYLLTSAGNLASAVGALHQAGYCIGDLNESNCMITPTALVTLIDCDSFQVPAAGGRILPCAVGKPEYMAPELAGRALAATARTTASDAFALAVVAFQLLMQGYHPFTGRWQGSGDPPPVMQRIGGGMYAYVPGTPLLPPRGAPPIDVLPPSLRRAFRRAFVDGLRAPARRPVAAEWVRSLRAAADHLQVCDQNAQHHYALGARRCPWCVLSAAGREFFPERLGAQRAMPPPGELPRPDPSPSRRSAPPVPATAVAGTPSLQVDPAQITIGRLPRGGRAAARFTVRNVGKAPFGGAVDTAGPVPLRAVPAALTLSPYHGENEAEVTVHVDARRLASGRRHAGLVRITGNAPPVLVRVAISTGEPTQATDQSAEACVRVGVWAAVAAASGASLLLPHVAPGVASAALSRVAAVLLRGGTPGAAAAAAWLLSSAWMVRRQIPFWRRPTWEPWREAAAGAAATVGVGLVPPAAGLLMWADMAHPSAGLAAQALCAAWGGLSLLVARAGALAALPLARRTVGRGGHGRRRWGAVVVAAALGLGGPSVVAGLAACLPAPSHAAAVSAPAAPPAPRAPHA